MLTLNRKFASLTLLFLIAVSFFGLILAVVFVVNPPEAQDDFALRKPVAGSALAVVCVLGIFAALYPTSCAGIVGLKEQDKTVHSFHKVRVKVLRGHHATCKPYSTHVVKIGNKIFCASCSGLLVGAVIVLVCVGLFFFLNLRIGEKPFVPVLVGVVGVVIALLYPVVPVKFQNGFTRFFAGVLLAVGSFLIVAGVEEAAKSLSVDLFFVALSVLWLATKMSLSQWEHRRICARCSLTSCDAEPIA
jgi:RsiW-degrading membrane proteinase PrsW (M82 family)